MRRRSLSFLMALMFIMICANTAFADNEPKIYGDIIQCKSGETVEYSVHISGNPGIVSYVVAAACEDDWLYFDDTVKQGDFTPAGTITESNDVRFMNVGWFNNDEIPGDGTLFTLTVHISPSAPSGEYPIKIAYSPDNTLNGSFEQVEFETVEGCITVQHEDIADIEQFAEEQEKNPDGAPISPVVWAVSGGALLLIAVALILVLKKKRN